MPDKAGKMPALPMSEDLLALFRKTGALLAGHFVLRSGLHSREYFQCALLLQHTEIAAKICGWLADKLRQFGCDTVISPALGGIIVGQEVGRSLGKRHIFAEKDEGKLVLRRGFQILPNEKFVVVEDVVTRGGRVQETIDIVRAHGGEILCWNNSEDSGSTFVVRVPIANEASVTAALAKEAGR